jgi:hypothetical protein
MWINILLRLLTITVFLLAFTICNKLLKYTPYMLALRKTYKMLWLVGSSYAAAVRTLFVFIISSYKVTQKHRKLIN